jgi:hypothetical protein
MSQDIKPYVSFKVSDIPKVGTRAIKHKLAHAAISRLKPGEGVSIPISPEFKNLRHAMNSLGIMARRIHGSGHTSLRASDDRKHLIVYRKPQQ